MTVVIHFKIMKILAYGHRPMDLGLIELHNHIVFFRFHLELGKF